jgi:hypothetical protein
LVVGFSFRSDAAAVVLEAACVTLTALELPQFPIVAQVHEKTKLTTNPARPTSTDTDFRITFFGSYEGDREILLTLTATKMYVEWSQYQRCSEMWSHLASGDLVHLTKTMTLLSLHAGARIQPITFEPHVAQLDNYHQTL